MSNRKTIINRYPLLAKLFVAGSVLLCSTGNVQAALQITKTVDPISPSPAAENDVVRYNLSVTNTGPGNLNNVIINDVPDNLTNLNYTVTSPSPPPNSSGPGPNDYRFNNLSAGETLTLNLDATVNAADTCPVINNAANVSESSGTFNDSATAASIEYDFELTSGAGSNVITHVAGTSYCEFCDTGEIHIRITNPTTAAFQNITLSEDLQSLGLTYIPGTTTSTIGGAADPSISGTQLSWTSAQIPALTSLAAGNTLEISFRVSTYTEAMILVDPNRNIIASINFDISCLTGTQTLNTGQFELPIRQPVPQVLKQGRNYDAAQNTWDGGTVYGNQNDDVMWRIRVRNQGAAETQALLMSDAITGNFDINYICPNQVQADAIGANNGVAPGGSQCVAMTTPFDVDDPFGNNIPDPNDIDASSDGYIYYVGRIRTDHTNETNTADISWGCEATSPGGGLITVPASTGGSTPTVNLDDSANLSTVVVPGNLQVTQTVTGSNTGQPLGTKGLVTITLNNLTGGSITNIDITSTLPAGYIMDNSYGVVNGVGSGQPTFTRTPAFQNYDGFIDTFTRDDAELATPDPLDDLTPHFTLTSTTSGDDPEQIHMLRHGDEVSFTFGIIMVEATRFDKAADIDVTQENTGDGTDPTSAVALSNTVTVNFDAVDPAGLQNQTRNVGFNYNSDPEDLDIDISDSLFILTNDVNVPLDLNVILTNNGGHDADDHMTYISFGQTITVQIPAAGCSVTSNPPPHPYWSTPATIPINAAVYACDRGVLAPGASETFTFSVIKNTTGAGIAADDLTFRAEVIGEITHFDGSLLTDPTPALLTYTSPQQQLANNYTLDTIRSRVLGFNLTKTLSGNCTEDNPPPIANTNVIIGEDCPWHIESGGWFGFLTPGYTLIAVEDVVVTDDLPNGQGLIHYDNVNPFNFNNDASISLLGANGGAGNTPLDETDISWQFNAAGNGITIKDQFFRVDLKTRLLNDPVDASAAPNNHSAISTNIGRTSFNALFQSDPVAGVAQPPLYIPVSETLGIPGYPLEPVRRVDLTVTEPSITVTKQVCNETRNGFGINCNGGVFADLVDDGDTTDSYIFKITLTNEASNSGVTRAPAYNVISTDILDASDLMLVAPFASDNLDNDGDGFIDALDPDGEGSISDNIVNNGNPAEITFDSTHSAPLLRVDPGDSVTFYYRVDPDDLVAPFQLLTNTVSMSYDTLDGDFGNQNTPQISNTGTPDNGRARIYTTTPAQADVRIIPVLTEPKSIVQLSNSPVGGPPQPVVPGEEIQYKLVASIPAANLRDFKIRDELPQGIRCIEGQVVNLDAAPYSAAGFSPGGTFAASTCTSTGSNDVIEWQFGDQALTALLPGDRFDFEISFIARVENTAFTSNGTVISNGDPATVTTTSYVNESGTLVVIPHAAVNVVVNEPQIDLTKSFAPVVNSDAGDVLTVTVTATNSGSAAAYNLRVLDDLVGSDFSYIVGSVSGTDPPDNVDLSLGPNQPVFSWNSGNPDYEITPAAVRSFTFKVRVDNTAQPLEILNNTLQAAWSSLPGQTTALNTSGNIGADGSVLGLRNGALPNAGNTVNDYETTASAATTVPPLTMTKTVIAPAVVDTIGAHKHFRIEILLPEGTTNNLVVTDDLNQGSLSYVLANNADFDISYSFSGIASINSGPLTEASFTFPADNSSGLASWNFGTVVTLSEDDLSSSNISPSIIIDYYARADNVMPEANEGDTMQNSVSVDYTDGETGAAAPQLQDSTAPVTVVEPDAIVLGKTYVSNLTNPGVAPDQGDVLQYRITVTNNDTITAYDFNIRDELPVELQLDTGFTPTALINGVAVVGFNANPAGSPAGPLLWGRGNADNSLDIPAGQSLVLTYQAVVQTLTPLSTVLSNSVYADWTSLDGNSAYERTGEGCPAITAPNDYCIGPETAQVALVEPELILEKRGPAGTVQYGTGIPYTLVLENTGNGTAFGAHIVDQLPDTPDNPPLSGGTCDTAPQNFNVRITSAADETTVLRALTEGVDYTVSHTAAPACELVFDMVSLQSGIVAGEKLLVTYDAYLDSGTQGGALLSNIAGVTTWYSQDVSGGTGGRLAFTRSITDGTPGVVDHQDTATVTAEAPIVNVEKTVVNVTTGQDPGNDATPGDTLRYTIIVSVPNVSALDAAGMVVTDAVPANASYVADSLTLNGLPVGQPDGGVLPLIAGVEISSSDHTPPLPAPGSGLISIGESATLTFDVVLDPVITSGTVIQNQATASSPATGDILSDDPNLGGTEDFTETLITSAPAFLVQKISQDISGDPSVLNAGDRLRYTITVKNIGTENAVNVVLSDQIPANTVYDDASTTTLNGVVVPDPASGVSILQSGLIINAPENTSAGLMRADTDAAADNVATITFDVRINASVVDGAVISNQGFVTGEGVGSGAFPQQPSDDPATPHPDDPTLDVVGNVPVVDVLKVVSIENDLNGDGIVDPGDTLHYIITATNIGAIPATGVRLVDSVPVNTTYVANSTTLNGVTVADSGANNSPLVSGIDISSSDLTPPLPSTDNGVLSAGGSAVVSFNVTVNAGTPPGTVISNQGFVSSNEVQTEPSDMDGIDANGDQPTTIVVGDIQLLSITKDVTVVGGSFAQAGGQLEYVLRVTNIGSVAASSVVITDDIGLPLGGQKTYVANSGLLNGLPAGLSFAGTTLTADYATTYGNLAAGDTVELRFRVTLDSALTIGTTITNSGEVSWDTPAQIASASVNIDIGGTPGSANLNGQVWHDTDYDNVLGTSETLLPNWQVELYRNNNLLANTQTDTSGSFQFTGLQPNLPVGDGYEIRYIAPGAGATTATLGTASSAFTNGPQRINDIFAASGGNLQNLDLPRQPNGIVYDSVLRVPVAGVQLTMVNQTRSNQTLPASCFEDPNHQNQVTSAEGFYKFDLNFSDPLRCAEGDEYEIQIQPPANDYIGTTSVIIPPVEPVTGNAEDVPNCPGSAMDQVPATTSHCENSASAVQPDTSIAPRTAGTNYYLKFLFNDVPATDQIYNNHIPVDPQLDAAVAITKIAGLQNVTRGQLVPYTITLNNAQGVPLFDLTVIDNFPAGFKYVAGSSRLDGAEVEPVVAGRQLSWQNLTLNSNQTHVIKLLLVVGSGVGEGEYVNTAHVINSLNSDVISGVASATVRVIPDPTFDCTDIIGKVFDDKNYNGYQDDGEPGLPGVQVATARGLRITTDSYGRFHITCAVVANEIRGSNFIMKVDERSLPSGYRVTTENPRVLRATRGKMLKFNFGATIHRVVRLDLADGVFVPGKTTLRPQWQSRIDLLLIELQKDPSILRLSYLGENETEDVVEDRLDAIETVISERWREIDCCYKLTIEKEVFWRKGKPSGGGVFE